MIRPFTLLAAALALASCARSLSPASAPSPAPAPVAVTVPATADKPADPCAAAPGPDYASRAARGPSSRDTLSVTMLDVDRSAEAVFGDSAVSAPAGDATGPTWDIDVRSYERQARVQHFVDLFSGPARDRIVDRLSHGTRFEPMIRAKMREGGLPEDMYYLALIESGFDPNAYSRSAAVGMWQFMTSTARDMGMRVDWWVDERRDPVRSTTAAVRFIKGLQEQFGSLYLAAAAYNGGPGRIARGLTRYAEDLQDTQGEDLFFALADRNALREETREYVPQLIASALIGKDPHRYGMDIPVLPTLAYDSVLVGPHTALAAVARAAGATVAQLQDLNPHILRGMTPPHDSLRVRIPVGAAAQFDSAFAMLDATERSAVTTVTSREGQYLETIAKKAGLTAKQLAMFNPKLEHTKSGRLVPGQAVLVPSAATVAAAVPVPDPSIERYPTSPAGDVTHIVRTGETLGGIAKRYATTTKRLMELNGLRRDLIFPGQTLLVPRTGSSAKPKPGQRPSHPVG